MRFWEKFNLDIFGGDENKAFLKWRKKKIRSIFIRSYLSLILASLLTVLAIIRELVDIFANDFIESADWLRWTWRGFLVLLIGAVIVEVVWEYRGDKLDVSEQEKRFAVGMRDLLSEIERLKKHLSAAKELEDVDRILNTFTDNFLNTSCNVLCGNNAVHAGVMFHDPNTNSLNLYNKTIGSDYPEDLRIMLDDAGENEKGPAQMAFDRKLLAHMPSKSSRLGWLYKERDGQYVFKEFIRGWFEPPRYDSDVYESVLSVPITSYAKEGKKAYHGVLSYTTVQEDHFIPRDYVMAVCFASILAQAKDAARFKIGKLLSEPSEDD